MWHAPIIVLVMPSFTLLSRDANNGPFNHRAYLTGLCCLKLNKEYIDFHDRVHSNELEQEQTGVINT